MWAACGALSGPVAGIESGGRGGSAWKAHETCIPAIVQHVFGWIGTTYPQLAPSKKIFFLDLLTDLEFL